MPPDNGRWRTKGAPHYLGTQAARLGLPRAAVEHPRVKDNRQLSKLAGLLGQLQREYSDAPRLGDGRNFGVLQMRAILGVLETCEGEVGKVHAIAAAGAEMVGEAYDAFGLDQPARTYAIVVAPDHSVESVEVASLRSEVERLRVENESLAERLTNPAADPAPAPIPPHTNPHQPHKSRSPARS